MPLHALSFLSPMQPTTGNSFFGKCANCPMNKSVKELITEAFDRKGVDKVDFHQWIPMDRSRSTLEKSKLSADEFVQIFHEKLQALLAHDFVAKIQMAFLQNKKEELINGEFLIIGDFAENYAFIVHEQLSSSGTTLLFR